MAHTEKTKLDDFKIAEFTEFAKFISETCVDEYGHLLLDKESDGEFCVQSFKDVAKEFLQTKTKK